VGVLDPYNLLIETAAGLTKPGEVGEILVLYQLMSPSLDSKAKFKLPCFFYIRMRENGFIQINKENLTCSDKRITANF